MSVNEQVSVRTLLDHTASMAKNYSFLCGFVCPWQNAKTLAPSLMLFRNILAVWADWAALSALTDKTVSCVRVCVRYLSGVSKMVRKRVNWETTRYLTLGSSDRSLSRFPISACTWTDTNRRQRLTNAFVKSVSITAILLEMRRPSENDLKYVILVTLCSSAKPGMSDWTHDHCAAQHQILHQIVKC